MRTFLEVAGRRLGAWVVGTSLVTPAAAAPGGSIWDNWDLAHPVLPVTGLVVACVFLVLLQRRHQREKEQSETVFRTVFESSPQAVALLDSVRDPAGRLVDFRYRRVNEATVRILGRSVQDVVGRRILEVLPGLQAAGVFERILRVAETGTPDRWDSFYNADGVVGWFSSQAVRLGDGVLLTTSDVTRQKEIEEELRASENRFSLLFRDSPVGIVLVDPWDEACLARIVDINTAAAAMHGYQPRELRGRSLTLLQVDPYTRASLGARVHFLRQAGSVSDERLSRRRDGVHFPVKISARLVQLNGRELILSVNLDATAWRSAERARDESEAIVHAIYDHSPFATGVLEIVPGDFRLLSANRRLAASLGVAPEEVPGRLLSSLGLTATEREEAMAIARSIGSGERPVTVERESRGRTLRLSFVPLPPAPGAPPRVCILAEDVTDRRRGEEELSQSRKLRALGELVGGIAHEFNNLLTPMLIKSEQLELRCADRPDLATEVRTLREVTLRAADLVRRVLSFGRRANSRVVQFALAEVVDSTIDLVRQTVDRRIDLVKRIPPGLPTLHLSRDEVGQVLLNLVLNARDTLTEKLGQRSGDGWQARIEVEAAALEGYVRLTVRDNGMGIPPHIRDRIFEPFFTTKDAGRGTGLGLATVWHFVTAMHGRIELESEPGLGTAFNLYLPVAAEPAESQAAEPVAVDGPAATPVSGLRLLLAEDDPHVARSLVELLRGQGHRVTHAEDGKEAVGLLLDPAADYDLLITDLNLPGISGADLIRRAREGGSAVRVIILSGRLPDGLRAEMERLDVMDFLNKPISIHDLLSAVTTAWARKPVATV